MTFDTPKDISSLDLCTVAASGGDANFRIDSVAFKFKGEDDYETVPGSGQCVFKLGGDGQIARLLPQTGKRIAKDVVGVRLTGGCGTGYTFTNFAELHVCGRDSVNGLVLIFM